MVAFGIAAARSETMPAAVTRRKPTRQQPFERQRAPWLAREKPSPKRRRKTGRGDGDRFRAGNMTADYLALCRNPLKDLRRWLAEDKKKAGGIGRRVPINSHKGERPCIHSDTNLRGKRHGLRRQSLPDVRVRLDTDGKEGGR